MFDVPFRRTCILLALSLAATNSTTSAIPFLPQQSPTITEHIDAAQVAVIAKLVELPPSGKASLARFEIVQVLKGAEILKDLKHIDAPYTGSQPVGTRFLLIKGNPPRTPWRIAC
jgi:hypothetical protein